MGEATDVRKDGKSDTRLSPLTWASDGETRSRQMAASIEWFNRWIETGDPVIKQRILDYNEDDCRATRNSACSSPFSLMWLT